MRLVKNLDTALDRAFYMLLGALLTLNFLHSPGRDFGRETAIVTLGFLPLGLLAWWSQRRKRRAGSGEVSAPPSIHEVLAIAFGAAAGIMFIAGYTFGIEGVGNWSIVPALFAYIAMFFIPAKDPLAGESRLEGSP